MTRGRGSRLAGVVGKIALGLLGLVMLGGLAVGAILGSRELADRDGTLWKRGGYGAEFTNGYVHSLAFSPDGRMLASLSRDGRLFIRDAATGSRLRAIDLRFHDVVTDAARLLAFSPDGRMLAVAANPNWPRPDRKGRLALWDPDAGTETRVLEEFDDHVDSLAFDPSGARLVISRNQYGDDRPALEKGEIVIFDVAGPRIASFRRDDAPLLSVAFAPDGALVYVALDRAVADNGFCDGKIIVRQPDGAETAIAVAREPLLKAVAVSPRGDLLAATFVESPRVALYDRGGHLVRVLGGEGPVDARLLGAGAFSPDGRVFAYPTTAPGDGDSMPGWPAGVALWDVAGGLRQATLTMRFLAADRSVHPMGLAFSPDGATLAAGIGNPYIGETAVWRLPASAR